MITITSSSSTYDIYADFNVDMERDPNTYDVLKDINTEALKTSIRNILLTRKGTRRMQPNFGASLEEKLFEPLDERTGQDIGDIIVEQINLWDPDVKVKRVLIEVDKDNLRYNITISFIARTASIGTTTIKFILEQR